MHFKSQFNSLIEEYPGDDLLKWAQDRIRLRITEHRNRLLIEEGPCLFCDNQIPYTISDYHRKYKDKWLIKIRADVSRPFQLDLQYRWQDAVVRLKRKSMGKIRLESISGYICSHCMSEIRSQVITGWEAEMAKRQARAKARKQNQSIEQSDASLRKTMPYREFLRTEYWNTVRVKALRAAGYECQLCKTSGELHVHHKTYENRGNELNNMKDLIVLCAPCHSKFHDHAEPVRKRTQVGMPSAHEVSA